jgi:hypothetical protein
LNLMGFWKSSVCGETRVELGLCLISS